MLKTIQTSIMLAGITCLAACSGSTSNLKDSLGLTKDAPDEFSVVTRAPLELPKDFSTLPPPVPGKPRAQEKSTIETAKETLFGNDKIITSSTTPAGIEAVILNQAGANDATSNIRNTIDQETAKIQERNIPVAKKLLKLGGKEVEPESTIVDSAKEYERIKKNIEEGKSILDGDTPIIEK